MSLEKMLQQLDKVKQTGPRKWQACCPAHDDKGPSLAIKEVDDGRVLIHCFAGCGAAEVMYSLGMSYGDLYPNILSNMHSVKSLPNRWSANDVLQGLALEALVIYHCGRHLENGEPLPPVDQARLRVAVSRLLGGIDVCNRA
jgi:hypothetical protein